MKTRQPTVITTHLHLVNDIVVRDAHSQHAGDKGSLLSVELLMCDVMTVASMVGIVAGVHRSYKLKQTTGHVLL